ncbi:MAG: hypothetical protein FWD23_16075, partial [Oscillospiraceae bacterium]|nr:hypothetical protein [Oscillospiraceae bacterium]
MIKTPNNRERNNITIFLLFTVISGVAANILSEGYIQAYLMKLGFDTEGIRNYGITLQTVSIFAYMIFMRLPPVKSGIKKKYAGAILFTGIFPSVLAAAGYIPSFPAIYMTILVAGALYGFLNSFRVVAEFSMLPHLFSRNLYGTTVSKAMVAGGVITVGISVFTGFLFEYNGSWVYVFLFGTAAVVLIISALLVMSYKFENGEPAKAPPRTAYFDLLGKVASARYMKILSPHFLRGIATAGMYYIIPSALENINLSDNEISYLIIISVVSTMTGSFIFMRLNDKVKSGIMTFISVIVCSSAMPFLVICKNKYLFYILYLIFFIFNIIASISIPTGVLRSTPDD